MSDYQTVKVSIEDRTAVLTVDNPPANAFNTQQMQDLEFEIQKRLRETRADTPDQADLDAVRDRNRRISRIENAVRVLRHSMQQKRMGRL